MNPLYQLLIMYSLSTASLTAAVLHYTQPFFLLGLRMTLAGALLLSYLILRNRAILTTQLNKQHSTLYAQIILFTVFIPYALRYYGLSLATGYVNSGTGNHAPVLAPLVYNLGPIVTFFLAHIFGVEKISWQRATALCISFVGLLLCLDIPLLHYFSTFSFSPLSFFGLPEYALLLSLISFSYGWIIMRKLVVDLSYSPLLVNGIAMFGGGVMGLISSFYLEPASYISNYSLVVPLLIITIIISNIVGHSLYASLLRKYSLTLLQLGYWLIPAVSKIANLFFLAIPATLSAIGADLAPAALLFTGFALLYKTEQKYLTSPSTTRIV
jgi:drug/metabolite transporter (DMT)-like permease